jgi:hypothetical protein
VTGQRLIVDGDVQDNDDVSVARDFVKRLEERDGNVEEARGHIQELAEDVFEALSEVKGRIEHFEISCRPVEYIPPGRVQSVHREPQTR